MVMADHLSLCRPGFIAKRLCPDLIIVKPDFSKYTKASGEVQAVFREYDPEMEAASMDEAYLDVTDYCASHDMPGNLADTGWQYQETLLAPPDRGKDLMS